MSTYYDDLSTVDSEYDMRPQRSYDPNDDESTIMSQDNRSDNGEKKARLLLKTMGNMGNIGSVDDLTSLNDQTTTDEQSEIDGGNKQRQITPEMYNDLKQFIDIMEQIRNIKDDMKILLEAKVDLETKIAGFMMQNDIPAFITPNGKISVYEPKAVKPLNKDYLREVISKTIQDDTVINQVMDEAFNKRPTGKAAPKIRVTPAGRK